MFSFHTASIFLHCRVRSADCGVKFFLLNYVDLYLLFSNSKYDEYWYTGSISWQNTNSKEVLNSFWWWMSVPVIVYPEFFRTVMIKFFDLHPLWELKMIMYVLSVSTVRYSSDRLQLLLIHLQIRSAECHRRIWKRIFQCYI